MRIHIDGDIPIVHSWQHQRVAQFGGAVFAFNVETIRPFINKAKFRFFMQQFKRSCLPDGPKVGTLSVSPRGDLMMPSDACVRIWMDELEQL